MTEGWNAGSDFEPIAERVHGKQMPRLAGNVFDLLAQFHDQLIEGARGSVIVDAPDFVEGRFRACLPPRRRVPWRELSPNRSHFSALRTE